MTRGRHAREGPDLAGADLAGADLAGSDQSKVRRVGLLARIDSRWAANGRALERKE